MCGHKQIGIWEISKITVVDRNDKNRGNVDCTCHQPVIYDVTVKFDTTERKIPRSCHDTPMQLLICCYRVKM